MEYEKVEQDFIERSLAILRQYDEYVRPSIATDQHYEVTLLLNCLLGLVVLPFEYSKREQDNERFPRVCEGDETPISQLDATWGLDELNIEKFILDGKVIEPNAATLRQIVAMFRHSMAHTQFGNGSRAKRPLGVSVDYQNASDNPIESVIIKVILVNEYMDRVEFVATIPADALRKFASHIARAFLDRTSVHRHAS